VFSTDPSLETCMRSPFRRLFVIALLLASPVGAEAQDPGRIGSRLLSTDSWTYEAVEQLLLRGHLSELNPLSQPFRRIDVAWALRSLDPEQLAHPVADWVTVLREELAPELERLAEEEIEGQMVGMEIVLGGSAADSRRRDPLFPYRTQADEGFTDRAWWRYSGNLWFESHNVAAETRLAKDAWWKEGHGDPDGNNPGGFEFLGRTDNAYVTAAFSWGNLWLGRFRRNWSPIGQTGLMIGHNPTSYPQIGLDLGRGSFSFQYMAGELNPLDGRKRYVVANRLDYGGERLRLSVGEAAVYSGEDSPLRLMNPVEFIFFDHNANNDRKDISGNVMFNAMFWTRVGEATFFGEAVLDDFDLNPRTGTEDRPVEATSYQVSLGGRYHGIRDDVVLGFDYRRVSAWSYRSGPAAEIWTQLNRGLADPWSDYDRTTLRLDLFPRVFGLRLSPVFQYQRAGEGDYREPFPPGDGILGMPGIFHGVMETTKRIGLEGRYQPRRFFFLDFDLGRSFIENAGHVRGHSEQRFSFEFALGTTVQFGLEH